MNRTTYYLLPTTYYTSLNNLNNRLITLITDTVPHCDYSVIKTGEWL